MAYFNTNEIMLRQKFLYFLKLQYPNGVMEDGTSVSEVAKNPNNYKDMFNIFTGMQSVNSSFSGTDIFTNSTQSTSTNYTSAFKDGFNITDINEEELEALLSDEKAIKLLGLDKNGKISEKLKKLLKKLDGDSSSFGKDDFNKLKSMITNASEHVSDEDFSRMLEKAVAEIDSILNNLSPPLADSASDTGGSSDILSDLNSSTGSSSDIPPPSDSTGATSPTPGRNTNTTNNTDAGKNISGMTLDELKNELSTANTSVAENTSALNSVINESSPELTEMKNAAEEAYNAYQELLKETDEKLAEELDKAKSDVEEKEKAIQETETQINDKQNELDSINADISTAESNLSALESSLSALESAASSDDEEKKAAAQSKIQAVKAQIEETKAEIEKLKAQKEAIENEISELENQKSQQETELEEANAVLTEVQTRVATLTTSNPELKAAQEQYEAANKAVNEFKTEQKAACTEQLQKSKEHVREVQAEINKRESSKLIRENTLSGLTLSHNENGTDYDVVGINGFDSLEEFQKYVKNAGLTNLGKFGTKQCLNYSNIYGQLILGVANEELEAAFRAETEDETFGDIDRAGELGKQRAYNIRNFRPVYSKNLDEELNTVATELQAGRPVVFGNQSGSHYMIIVGMKQGATPPYSEGDFLMMDSYNGSISQLGTKRNIGKSNSLFVYQEGFRYTSTDQRIRYEELRDV